MTRPAALLTVLLLGACAAPAPGPDAVAVRRRVEGLITEVRTQGGAVVAFTVDVEFEQILIDPDRDYGFDLTHLNEHRDLKQPVSVSLETRQGRLYAVSIDDA